jgi:hypothetical protein
MVNGMHSFKHETTERQVSQAILLDQFVAVSSNTIAEEEAERRRARRSEELIHNTLDPLMEKLTEDYIDDVDLSHRLQDLFKARLEAAYFSSAAFQ